MNLYIYNAYLLIYKKKHKYLTVIVTSIMSLNLKNH